MTNITKTVTEVTGPFYVGQASTTTSDEYKWYLEKVNTDADVKIVAKNDKYIIGPLGIQNVGKYKCENFSFEVIGDGGISDTVTEVCNADGSNPHQDNGQSR